METVLELKYTAADDFVCPMADTKNCLGKNDGTYKTRKGLVDHVHRKHCATVIWICSECSFKGKGRYSYRQVKQHYYVTHANTPETVQPSGSTELQILQNIKSNILNINIELYNINIDLIAERQGK